jgi:oxygen-independent coproporphyrinogen-3 oxidase
MERLTGGRCVRVLMPMTSLGIYVQVPFCQTRCTYCNFHTGVVSFARFAPYVAAVCSEIERHRELYTAADIAIPSAVGQDARPDTVYIGGGTPTLLDPTHLQNMLDTIRATFSCELREVTLEADPETVDVTKAAAWVAAGINRVSFGVQSFSDRELAAAGRMHRQADIYRAASILRVAGIHKLLKGGTRYSAQAVPSEDQMAEFYEVAQTALAGAGYRHYEISNWAKPGFESRHNLKYWQREPYLGFGAGAHSFSGTQRWANAHDAAGYVMALQDNTLPVEQLENVTPEAALEEELFLGLRQLDGIDVSRIERNYAVSVAERFAPLASSGLVEWDGPVVRLAPSRLSVSNEVFVELLR